MQFPNVLGKTVSLLVVMLLSACTTSSYIPDVYDVNQDQVLAPINLNVSVVPSSHKGGSIERFIRESFEQSQVFEKVQSLGVRTQSISPITVDVSFSHNRNSTFSSVFMEVISGASLGLIPFLSDETIRIEVTVLDNMKQTASKKYSADYESLFTFLSLFSDAHMQDSIAALRPLISAAIDDIRQNKTIVPMKEYYERYQSNYSI